MKKAIIILFFGFILAACSNGEIDSTLKTNDGIPTGGKDTEKQEQSSQSNEEGEAIEQEAPEEKKGKKAGRNNESEEGSWQGEWAFISDDMLGELHIEQEGDQIRLKLIGSVMAETSYGNAFEGTGTITGNEVTFTNGEGCGGVMKKSGSTLTLTADEVCHTQRVYLNGEYLKVDAIETHPLLAFEEGQFFVYGTTLGGTPSQTKRKVGNPLNEGPDEEGFYAWMQDYPSKNLLVTYDPNQKVESIHVQEGPNEVNGAVALAKAFDGERYSNEEGSTYLYNPDNGQLLVFTRNGTSGSFFVTQADGNFHYGVESGAIRPY